jgi:hypothetical protein
MASWSGVKLSRSGHAGHCGGLRRLDREVDHDHFVAMLQVAGEDTVMAGGDFEPCYAGDWSTLTRAYFEVAS